MGEQVAPLEVEHVEPRMVSIRVRGRLDTDAASEAMDLLEQAIRGEPYFLLEVIVDDLDGVVAEARKVVADRVGQMPKRAIAIVGGGFAQRVVAKLVLTAIIRLGGGTTMTQGNTFANSEKARQWLHDMESSWSS